MTYKYYSQTSSGWTISTDPKAPKNKRWRAKHPRWGEKFFAEHDQVLDFTLRHLVEQFKKMMGPRDTRGME